ncbi:MAG TPA: ABC transporter permease [Phycisphaerales bacterium]|nr:ABC transporter permease [Phycisphaerales bacterium]
MSKVMTVALREFKQTVMRPVFLLAIFGLPVLIIGVGVLAAVVMVNHKEPALIGKIVIVSPNTAIVEAAQLEMDRARAGKNEPGPEERAVDRAMRQNPGMMGAGSPPQIGQRGEVNVTVEHAEEGADIEQLKNQVRNGELLGLAQFQDAVFKPLPKEPDAPDERSFQLFVNQKIDSNNVKKLERHLASAVVRVRAEATGIGGDDAMEMMRAPESETTRSQVGGGEKEANEQMHELRAQLIPMVFMMLIWIGAFSAGQPLMLSTIEEKSNKVMEVLLSAVSPMQLMTGKILGYGAVGLVIVGIYSSLGVGSLIALALFSDVVQWMHLVYLGLYFIMAYSMISSIMAAVGSAVSDVREANTLIMPVMMILMVPLMLWMPISQSPNGTVAMVCSFVPPAIPFAMILRIVSEESVPTWQIAASLVWGYACVVGLVWFAARVFRVGVLMTGKPPSILELIKWVRYS